MAKKANMKSKLLYHVWTPMRILKKARQLYMKGVEDCAGGLAYGGAVAANFSLVQLSQLPQSFAVHSSKPGASDHHIEQRQSLTRVARRNVGGETTLVMQRQRQTLVGYKEMRREYYSIGPTKMERIDEDKTCFFEDDQIDVRTRLLYLYPRTRSNVVNRHVVNYQ